MKIVGVDEAGRGPVAGPVAVGVVAMEEGVDLLTLFPGLNDSKKLTEKKRDALFSILEEESTKGTICYHVAFSRADMIDKEGIVPAVQQALDEGVVTVLSNPAEGKVYLDGSLHAPKNYLQETIIGGDALVPAIMLASVAAKVLRDRVMIKLSSEFPEYGFEKHKGYGTKAHYAALHEYGLCSEHRKSFLKNI